MRYYESNGISINYPDEINFVFNPNIINISGIDYDVIVEIISSYKNFSIVLSPYNGKAFINISEFTNLIYERKSLFSESTGKMIYVNLRKVSDGSSIFSFSTFCIWGSINVGEIFNSPRELTWFRKFPFMVSFYTSKGSKVYKSSDGSQYEEINGNTDQAICRINPSNLFYPREYGIITIEGNGESYSTFDDTFDDTFCVNDDSEINIKLLPNDCENGIYLRWIDKHGFIQYYLFKEGEETKDTSDDGETIYEYYFSDGKLYDGINRMQSKLLIKKQTVFVPLINANEFDFLEGAYSSPIIDIYMGKDRLDNDIWYPIKIQVGSLVRSMKALQDFSMVIIYPEYIKQKL